jgi:hypothetical protein
MLKRNPHYAWCRKLGQLQPPRHFIISAGGNETFISNEVMQGKRIGEIKPRVLSLQSGWSQRFAGHYLFNP